MFPVSNQLLFVLQSFVVESCIHLTKDIYFFIMIYLVLLILVSCCSNVIFLEALIRDDPGCGNVVTFFQFLTIAVEGFVFATNCGQKKPVVPLKNYLFLVTLFFSVSVANNYALNFDISMPIHMIFKSGSLAANMFLGMIILKRRYSLSKYISVLMVSVGIFIATFASQNEKINKLKEQNNESDSHQSFISKSMIGILLLLSALLVSAGLGIYQEMIYKKYGKHPREVLFYSHALPLPGFLLLGNNIYHHSILFSESEPVVIPFLASIPKMWLYLLGNIITQYICVRSVFTASTYYSSLTVTMIITLRKFISLLFSILYFKNPFTAVHWFGTFLVFSGTLLFSDVLNIIYRQKWKTKAD